MNKEIHVHVYCIDYHRRMGVGHTGEAYTVALQLPNGEELGEVIVYEEDINAALSTRPFWVLHPSEDGTTLILLKPFCMEVSAYDFILSQVTAPASPDWRPNETVPEDYYAL